MNYGAISHKAFRCRQTGRAFFRFLSVWLVWIALPALHVDAQTVVEWDFSYGMHGWKGFIHETTFYDRDYRDALYRCEPGRGRFK